MCSLCEIEAENVEHGIPLTDEDQRIMSRTSLVARMTYMAGDRADAEHMETLEFGTTGCPACDVRTLGRETTGPSGANE